MPTTTSIGEKTEARERRRRAGTNGPPRPNDPRGPGGKSPGDRRSRREHDSTPERLRIGIWVGLVSVLMLFVAMTSAYVFIAVGGGAWRPASAPSFVWLSTALILAASVSVELARRAARRGEDSAARARLVVTVLLGLAFVAAQLLAWRQLAARGFYLQTNPHSSFFYMLTALHGIHVLGGLGGLAYLLMRRRSSSRVTDAPQQNEMSVAREQAAVGAVALYWHFMDGLWVYLVLLLFFWK